MNDNEPYNPNKAFNLLTDNDDIKLSNASGGDVLMQVGGKWNAINLDAMIDSKTEDLRLENQQLKIRLDKLEQLILNK